MSFAGHCKGLEIYSKSNEHETHESSQLIAFDFQLQGDGAGQEAHRSSENKPTQNQLSRRNAPRGKGLLENQLRRRSGEKEK